MNLEELKSECIEYRGVYPQEYGGWVWQVTDAALNALDEIERLQSQLASRDALIEKMIEVGNNYGAWDTREGLEKWNALIVEGRASKKESAE